MCKNNRLMIIIVIVVLYFIIVKPLPNENCTQKKEYMDPSPQMYRYTNLPLNMVNDTTYTRYGSMIRENTLLVPDAHAIRFLPK